MKRIFAKFLQVFSVFMLILMAGLNPVIAQASSEDKLNVQTNNSGSHRYSDKDKVAIRSIGDILIHDTVYENARTADGYDFDPMFKYVKEYLENADITTANLETVAAGHEFAPASYPRFNAPAEIVDSLKNVGVDIVSNNSNHTMDIGPEGAMASIENLQDKDMMYVGSYESWDDYNTPRIIEANGIKVGFLSYTYGLNGLVLPEDEKYLATLIDEELIPLEIEALNEEVDVSVVIYQAGEEYDHYPNDFQTDLFRLTRDAGANFVLGGHPHVLQPFVLYNRDQAGIFSHANFLSGQVELDTKLGGIIEYIFAKVGDDEVVLDSMRFMPTYNVGGAGQDYYVVPLADAAEHGLADADAHFAEIEHLMTYYTTMVEVVDYLD